MNWSELDLGAGQRHALRCSEETQRDRWLDELCQHLQQQAIHYGVLYQQGALLGNLSTQQNILLPARWQYRYDEHTLQQRMNDLLGQLGMTDGDTSKWLTKRTNQLSNVQLRAAIIVRALLTDPTVLVCDEHWFTEQNRAELQMLQRAASLCGNCCWLVVYTDVLPTLFNIDWQHRDLPSFERESVAV